MQIVISEVWSTPVAVGIKGNLLYNSTSVYAVHLPGWSCSGCNHGGSPSIRVKSLIWKSPTLATQCYLNYHNHTSFQFIMIMYTYSSCLIILHWLLVWGVWKGGGWEDSNIVWPHDGATNWLLTTPLLIDLVHTLQSTPTLFNHSQQYIVYRVGRIESNLIVNYYLTYS